MKNHEDQSLDWNLAEVTPRPDLKWVEKLHQKMNWIGYKVINICVPPPSPRFGNYNIFFKLLASLWATLEKYCSPLKISKYFENVHHFCWYGVGTSPKNQFFKKKISYFLSFPVRRCLVLVDIIIVMYYLCGYRSIYQYILWILLRRMVWYWLQYS